MHWHELQQQHNMDRGSVRAHHLVTPKTCEGFEVHAGLTRQGGRGAARGGGGAPRVARVLECGRGARAMQQALLVLQQQ